MDHREPQKVPKSMQAHFDAIVALTDAVCLEHLNDEYADLCRRLTAALCRKRPSPLAKGYVEPWACGIAYATGSVNFLFDRKQTPHLSAGELCALFGVSQRTGAARATEIRKLFDMYQMDPNWSRPSSLDQNPLVWMIQVDGFVVDARRIPREIQEQAFNLGLIPYVPAARLPADEPDIPARAIAPPKEKAARPPDPPNQPRLGLDF